MRKRKEKLEAWRAQKRLELEQLGIKEDPATTATDGEDASNADGEKKKWSLEDEEDDEEVEGGENGDKMDEEKAAPAPAPTKMEIEASTQPAAAAEEEDDVDPLDAYMTGIQQEVRKLVTVSTVLKDAGSASRKIVTRVEGVAPAASAPAVQQNKQQVRSKLGERFYADDEDQDWSELAAPVEEESALDKAAAAKKKREIPVVDHSKIAYIPFRKDLYIEVPELKKMTKEDVVQYRRDQLEDLKVRGRKCPRPIKDFSQCGLSSKIYAVMKHSSFEKPTPIQAQAIPAIMSGRDLIGCAKTGSGKTLAFLLPMLRHILDQPHLEPGEGPIGLIMAPTRELALQIHRDAKKFCKGIGLRSICVYGGSVVADQISKLKAGAEIVVCTPGRMIDILSTNSGRICNLRRVTFVVLDEADRMFDMGFEPQIMKILENVRPDRQTVMFSATFPRPVETAARKILQKPLEIVVGTRSTVCSDIEQNVEVRSEESKFPRLLELLNLWDDRGSILIFVDSQSSVDELFAELLKRKFPVMSLHGGQDQIDRDHTINKFKKTENAILVATSVVARGLDVPDLNLVVNYDCPNHMEDYVHRVGRTGRAGRKGWAYTFVTDDEDKYAPDLVKALEQSGASVPESLKKLADDFLSKQKAGLAKAHGSGFGGKGFQFNESEANKKKAERKRQRKALDLDIDVEESSSDEEEGEEGASGSTDGAIRAVGAGAPVAVVPGATPAAGGIVSSGGGGGPVAPPDASVVMLVGLIRSVAPDLVRDLPPVAFTSIPELVRVLPANSLLAVLPILNAQQAAQQAAAAAAAAAAGAAPGAITSANQIEAAKRAALLATLALHVKRNLAMPAGVGGLLPGGVVGPGGLPLPTGAAAPAAAAVPEPTHFECDLEINDYPQQARWKVTHKDALYQITELTGAAITTRGTFFPPGKTPGPGERKLFLFIEGPSEQSVKEARTEIKKILEEAALNVLARGPEKPAGKYRFNF